MLWLPFGMGAVKRHRRWPAMRRRKDRLAHRLIARVRNRRRASRVSHRRLRSVRSREPDHVWSVNARSLEPINSVGRPAREALLPARSRWRNRRDTGTAMAEKRSSAADSVLPAPDRRAPASTSRYQTRPSIHPSAPAASALVLWYWKNPRCCAGNVARHENWLKSWSSSPTFISYRDVARRTSVCSAPDNTHLSYERCPDGSSGALRRPDPPPLALL